MRALTICLGLLLVLAPGGPGREQARAARPRALRALGARPRAPGPGRVERRLRQQHLPVPARRDTDQRLHGDRFAAGGRSGAVRRPRVPDVSRAAGLHALLEQRRPELPQQPDAGPAHRPARRQVGFFTDLSLDIRRRPIEFEDLRPRAPRQDRLRRDRPAGLAIRDRGRALRRRRTTTARTDRPARSRRRPPVDRTENAFTLDGSPRAGRTHVVVDALAADPIEFEPTRRRRGQLGDTRSGA